jgi:hypothetical protein
MNPASIASSLLLVLFLALVSCAELNAPADDADVAVVVKRTTVNYDVKSMRAHFPDSSSLHAISSAFNGNYTEQRRALLVADVLHRVAALGEEPALVDTIDHG